MSNEKWKVIIALIMLSGAGYYAWSGYKKTVPSAEINNNIAAEQQRERRNDGERGPRRAPTPEERQERMQEMRRELGLTDEQVKKMEEARANNQGDWRQMREQMDQILTPEQREKIRSNMRSRMEARDAKTKAALSPEEFEAYRQRREERFAARRAAREGRSGGNQRPSGGQSGAR